MSVFAKILLTALLTNMLLGCSSFNVFNPFEYSLSDETSRLCARDNGEFHNCQDLKLEQLKTPETAKLKTGSVNFQMLSEYTEQMATALQQDLNDVAIVAPIVVASFVYLDASLQTTDDLGNQLAEYFINDLQGIGLPVSDHKLTGMLNVNEQGDFAFSRDVDQIHDLVGIGYVLSGTMLKNNRGVVVNVRLMDIQTKGVLASTSKLLPELLLTGMM